MCNVANKYSRERIMNASARKGTVVKSQSYSVNANLMALINESFNQRLKNLEKKFQSSYSIVNSCKGKETMVEEQAVKKLVNENMYKFVL